MGSLSIWTPADLEAVFGDPSDPIELVEARAVEALGRAGVVVWEGDPATFQFSFVSPAAAQLLGYPAERWVREPTFWADVVVHAEDRGDAIAYCALATGRCRDHVFEYRAVTADGRVVWFRDFVKVIVGARRGIPERLRGIMLDITDERLRAGTFALPPDPQSRRPSLTDLASG